MNAGALERWSAGALLLVACSAPRSVPSPQPVPAPQAACVLAASAQPESLSLAFSSRVDPAHVPVPTTVAERGVFAQLYEPLLDVSCDGQAQPALARSWTVDASRTRVTVVLRSDARFGSGAPVASSDVVAAWRSTGQSSSAWGALARQLVAETTIVDDHTLLISLPDTNVRVLAEPALAVYRPSAASPWPDGSGPYRVGASAADALTLLPVPISAPRLDIHMKAGDARDAIDAGADVVITNDPAAINYAEAAGGHTAVPLPWTRTYLLVAPGRVAVPTVPLSDAVHEDSRAAAPPGWLKGITQCEFDIVGARSADLAPRNRRLAYDSGDDVARQLAERLVALGVAPAAERMTPGELDTSLRAESEAAYVIAVPTQSLAPCATELSLRTRVPWLGIDSTWSGTLTPLVDTRLHAIVRTNRVPAMIDWDGTLHFGAPHVP